MAKNDHDQALDEREAHRAAGAEGDEDQHAHAADAHQDEHEDDHEHDDDEPADEDPLWWTPHFVLGILLLVGLFGFLGAFNDLLGPLLPHG